MSYAIQWTNKEVSVPLTIRQVQNCIFLWEESIAAVWKIKPKNAN
jgi:hypothetical protein